MQVDKPKIPLYQIMSAVQQNEAEYAGPMLAALFYPHPRTSALPALVRFGQIGYYYRARIANPKTNSSTSPLRTGVSPATPACSCLPGQYTALSAKV